MNTAKIVGGALLVLGFLGRNVNGGGIRSEDTATILGVVTGRILILVVALWLIVSGLRGRRRAQARKQALPATGPYPYFGPQAPHGSAPEQPHDLSPDQTPPNAR
ncbi:MAG: hypothetical protein Q3979_08355 [Actinomycetaceae bacterium]|nr:hypothetical protein [Actinomycetaceae bacterium]